MLLLAQVPNWVTAILVAVFLFVSVLLILAVLIQRPAGGGLSGAFGSGAGSGQTAFGAKTGDALTIATITIFVIYILFAIGLNYAARPVDPVADPAAGQPATGVAPETTPETPPTTVPFDPGALINRPPPTEGEQPAVPPGEQPPAPEPAPTEPTPPATEPPPAPGAPAQEPAPANPQPATPPGPGGP